MKPVAPYTAISRRPFPTPIFEDIQPAYSRQLLVLHTLAVREIKRCVYVADLADALVNAALEPRWSNRILELSGAEAITLAQGAERIAHRLGKQAHLLRLPRWFLRVLRPLARLLGFGTYEAILFYEMLADHGFHVAPGAAATGEVLGREPASIDAIIDSYYSDHARTAWRDSFYGTLVLRAS